MFFKRVPALTVGALIALSPVAGTMVAAPAAALSAEEQAFVDAINASRAAAGLPPLTVSEELSVLADLHSARMASSGTIYHSSDVGGAVGSVYANWTRAGENVGMGSTVESIHAAMLASPTHAANIYGDYNLLGVGVYTNPGGVMFVTQLFAKAVVESSVVVTEPAPEVVAEPAAAPAVTEVTEVTEVAPAPSPAPSAKAGSRSSSSRGTSAAKTRTVRMRSAGSGGARAAHGSAMGAARNAAHSGGRRGAPEWARNNK